jgi:uncharacterized membrane protein YqjE
MQDFAARGRALADILADLGLNRFEYLSVELQTRKAEAVGLAILAALTAFAGLMAAVLALGAAIYAIPEPYRGWVLIGLAVLGAAGAGIGGLLVGHVLRSRPLPFASSIDELKRDLDVFGSPVRKDRSDE